MPFCTHCGAQVAAGDGACPSCRKPPFGPVTRPAVARPAAARGGGAALWIPLAIGCAFVGIAVIGIVAAIAIPNLLDAQQRAKQKRTLADLRVFGGAIEAYRSEHGRLPAAESIDELVAVLAPLAPLAQVNAAPLPRQDGWQHPLRFGCWRATPASSSCDHYRVVSAGRDGLFEHEDLADYEPEVFPWGSYDRDIVWGDGGLVRYPHSPR